MICLKHFQKQRDRLGQAAVFGIFGVLYIKKKDYKNSIEYYRKALIIYKELNQIQEEITCLKGIGNNYLKLNQISKAIEVFLECSALCSDSNDIINLLDCLGNLTYIYEKQSNWEMLYELYNKILESFKQLRDTKGIITSCFNLGIVQKNMRKFDQANSYFEKGLKLALESNYIDLIIKGQSYIGEILFLTGKVREAKNEFIKALHMANRIKAKNAILQLKIILKSLGLSDKDIDEELLNRNDDFC